MHDNHVSFTDVLTLKMCYLECRHHEDEVPNHLMELDFQGLGVLVVSHVLFHHQVSKLRRQILDQEKHGEPG